MTNFTENNKLNNPKTSESLQELHLLIKLTLAISSAKDLKEAIDLTLKSIGENTKWLIGEGWLVNLERNVLEPYTNYCSSTLPEVDEFCAATQRLEFKEGEGFLGKAWKTKNSVWIENLLEYPSFKRKEEAKRAGIKSALAVPIPLTNEVSGLIAFYISERKEEDKHWIEILTAIAGQLGTVLLEAKTRQDLNEADLKFQSVVESAPEAIIISNDKGHIETINSYARNLFGYTLKEFREKNHKIIVPFDLRQEYKEQIISDLHSGGTSSANEPMEVVGFHKDGTSFPAELSIGAWKTNHKVYFSEIIRDISSRKKATEQQELMADIIESSDDAIFSHSLNGIILTWNHGAEKIYGYTSEDIIGKSIIFITHPDIHTECDDVLNGIKVGKHIDNCETLHVTKKGDHINVSLTISPIKNNAGQVTGVSCTSRNITSKIQAEQELQNSKYFIEQITAHVPYVITILDIKKQENIWINREIISVLGFSIEELRKMGRSALTLVHPNDIQIIQDRNKKLVELKDNETITIEFRIKHANGTWRWFRSTSTIFKRDSAGKPVQTLSIGEDFTARKFEQEKLIKNELFLRESQKIARVGSFEWDVKNHKHTWSEETYNLFDVSQNEPIGFETIFHRIHPDDRDRVDKEIRESFKSRKPYSTEFRVVRPDKKQLYIWARGEVFYDKDGKPERMIGTMLDITQQKYNEEELENKNLAVLNAYKKIEKAQHELKIINNELENRVEKRTEEVTLAYEKLQATNNELEEFAYIVSHDLKAPLRHISSLSEMIEEESEGCLNKESQEMLELLKKSVKRMSTLIDTVLRYSRAGKEKMPKEKVDLNVLVQEVAEHINIPDHIQLTIENPLPEVYVERIPIFQVFQNLIDNAVKYMDKEKGEITIGSSEEKDNYKLFIKDNGPGIDPKYHANIFKIFHTAGSTREDSTGIGLAVVNKIIKKNSGTISIESALDKGTTFYFTIPKAKEERELGE